MIYTKEFDFSFAVEGYEHRGHITIKTTWPGTLRVTPEADRRMYEIIEELVHAKGPSAELISVSRTESHQVDLGASTQAARDEVARTIAQAQASALARHRRPVKAPGDGDPGTGT
jgi:hypothetical protein